MKKYIISLLIIFFISSLAYEYRSPLYNKVMGNSYRPLLNRDIQDLQANINLVQGYFDPSCHDEYYKEELAGIDGNLSKQSFGLVRDLTRTKKRILMIQRELLDQLDVCANESLPENIVNVTLTLEGNVSTRTFNLTGRNITNKYLIIKNTGPVPIQPQIIMNGKDWSSLQAIVHSVISEEMTNHQKAVAIWEFVRDARYHFQKPLSFSYSITPLALFNSWGYANCGETSRAVIGLSRLAGFEAREVRLGQHIVAEICYDNDWHMLDADGEVIFLDQDGDILSVKEIENQPEILLQIKSQIYPPEYFTRAYTTTENNIIFNPTIDYTPFIYTLRPGESVSFQRGNEREFFVGDNYALPPDFSNGYFTYQTPISDGKVVELNYPYPIVGAELDGSFTEAYFSVNKWQWRQVTKRDLSDLFNNGQGVPDYTYFLKFDGDEDRNAIIKTKVQMATKSLPLLESDSFNRFQFIDRLQQEKAQVEVIFGLSYPEKHQSEQ